MTGANGVESNTFFSTSVAAALRDWEMDALLPLSGDVTRFRLKKGRKQIYLAGKTLKEVISVLPAFIYLLL